MITRRKQSVVIVVHTISQQNTASPLSKLSVSMDWRTFIQTSEAYLNKYRINPYPICLPMFMYNLTELCPELEGGAK